MLFIWTGKGYMVPVVLGASMLGTIAITRQFGGEISHMTGAIAHFICTIGLLKLHRFLDSRQTTMTIVDDATGESAPLVQKHDFYWIPLKYWPVVFGAASAYYTVQAFRTIFFGT